jgi:flagellar motor switch protein FliN/FliY
MSDMTETTAVEPEPQTAAASPEAAVEVQDVQLPEAHDQHPKPAAGQMDLLLDVTVRVQACLGEVETQVRDLLQINTGSVITLDRQVGEPVDLYLRGTRFATGHLVVVGDHLGVRIKEILQPGAADEPETGN